MTIHSVQNSAGEDNDVEKMRGMYSAIMSAVRSKIPNKAIIIPGTQDYLQHDTIVEYGY
jgi:hypothetical protein